MVMRLFLFAHLNQKSFHSFLRAISKRAIRLLRQLQHDVRNLDILLSLVFGGDFEDDVLLVGGDGLLADGLDKGGHPVEKLVSIVSINRV